ncbi:nitrilotriacetate monooxygenase, partial [Pseudomonas sp. GW456-E7]
IDLSAYPLDGPLPKLDADASNAVKSRFKLVQEMAERDNMTIRELYQYVAGSRGHHIFVGTPEQLADKMQEWVDKKACDGFNIMPPLLPEGIE